MLYFKKIIKEALALIISNNYEVFNNRTLIQPKLFSFNSIFFKVDLNEILDLITTFLSDPFRLMSLLMLWVIYHIDY
jgi:hypothetical protein